MSTPLPSWSHRDLETAISNLIDAEREIKQLTDAPDISNVHREIASEARAFVKTARQFLKIVRGRQEELLKDAQEKTTPAPDGDAAE